MDILRTVDGVIDVVADGPTIIVRVAHGATAIPPLVTALEHAGLPVGAVTLNRPSLDDVYLHHTGHRFAADGATSPSVTDVSTPSPKGTAQRGTHT
jgi:ABC-2 type transport system ATP-binding protein